MSPPQQPPSPASTRWRWASLALGVVLVTGAGGLATTAPTTGALPSWHLLLSLALFACGVLTLVLAARPPRRRERGNAPAGEVATEGAGGADVGDRPWWLDEVLRNPRHDAFGRGSFVQRAAGLIDDIASEPSSLVIGLVGPWGSGKSSTLNWILDEIDHERWKVAHTEAWATGGPDGVLLELLRVINSTVEVEAEDERHRLIQGIARAASTTLVAVAPAAEQIPVLGAVLSKVDWKTLLPSPTESPLNEQIKALRTLASRSPKSTLVVVDDVDRLHPEELLALFRAVRVVGRLPKVHYLLVYDEDTLLRLLSQTAVAGGSTGTGGAALTEGRLHAADFLEKIVTLPLVQPPVGREEIEILLRQRLETAVGQLGTELTLQLRRRLNSELRDFFGELVATPRAVVRFAAQLHSYLPLLRTEGGRNSVNPVDPVDFAVLTLLRMRYSTLYDALARDSWAFVTRFAGGEEVRDRWATAQALHTLGVPDAEQQLVHQTLRRLFPYGVGISNDEPEPSRRRRQHRDPPRIADADHTHLYFALVAPVTGGDETLATRAVEELLAGKDGEAWAALADVVLSGSLPIGVRVHRGEHAAARRAAKLLHSANHLHNEATPYRNLTGLKMLLSLATTLLFRPAASSSSPPLNNWISSLLDGLAWERNPQLLTSIVTGETPGSSSTARRILTIGHVIQNDTDLIMKNTALVDQVVEAAWQWAITANLADNNLLPRKLVRLIDDIRPFRLDALVRKSLITNEPISVVDLANRYGRYKGQPADARELIRIAGYETVRSELRTTPTRAGDPLLAAAQKGLLQVMDDSPDEELLLPREIDVEYNAPLLTVPQPLAYLDQSGVGGPDFGFTFTATFATPASQPAHDRHPSDSRSWRTAVAALTETSTITRWLDQATPSWHGEAKGWTLNSDDPPTLTIAHTGIQTGKPGLRTQRPVRVAFQLSRNLPGSAASPPGLQVSLEVRLWMEELDHERRPSEGRQQGEPLPAALSQQETVEVLEACWGWLAQAVQVVGPLLSEGERRAPVRLDVRSTGKSPWTVVALPERVVRRAGAPARQLTQQLQVHPEGVPSLPVHARRLADQTLHWWLIGQGAEDRGYLPW